jgi:hypothetical protein
MIFSIRYNLTYPMNPPITNLVISCETLVNNLLPDGPINLVATCDTSKRRVRPPRVYEGTDGRAFAIEDIIALGVCAGCPLVDLTETPVNVFEVPEPASVEAPDPIKTVEPKTPPKPKNAAHVPRSHANPEMTYHAESLNRQFFDAFEADLARPLDLGESAVKPSWLEDISPKEEGFLLRTMLTIKIAHEQCDAIGIPTNYVNSASVVATFMELFGSLRRRPTTSRNIYVALDDLTDIGLIKRRPTMTRMYGVEKANTFLWEEFEAYASSKFGRALEQPIDVKECIAPSNRKRTTRRERSSQNTLELVSSSNALLNLRAPVKQRSNAARNNAGQTEEHVDETTVFYKPFTGESSEQIEQLNAFYRENFETILPEAYGWGLKGFKGLTLAILYAAHRLRTSDSLQEDDNASHPIIQRLANEARGDMPFCVIDRATLVVSAAGFFGPTILQSKEGVNKPSLYSSKRRFLVEDALNQLVTRRVLGKYIAPVSLPIGLSNTAYIPTDASFWRDVHHMADRIELAVPSLGLEELLWDSNEARP